jgi:hypothetical protein
LDYSFGMNKREMLKNALKFWAEQFLRDVASNNNDSCDRLHIFEE